MDDATREWLDLARMGGRLNKSFWDQVDANLRAGNDREVSALVYKVSQAFPSKVPPTAHTSRREDTPVSHAAVTQSDHKTFEHPFGTSSHAMRPSNPRPQYPTGRPPVLPNSPYTGTRHLDSPALQPPRWTGTVPNLAPHSTMSTGMANPFPSQAPPIPTPFTYTAFPSQPPYNTQHPFLPNPYQNEFPPFTQLGHPVLGNPDRPTSSTYLYTSEFPPPVQQPYATTARALGQRRTSAGSPYLAGFPPSAQPDRAISRTPGPWEIAGAPPYEAGLLFPIQTDRAASRTSGHPHMSETIPHQIGLNPTTQHSCYVNRTPARSSIARASPYQPTYDPYARTVHNGTSTAGQSRTLGANISRPIFSSSQTVESTAYNSRRPSNFEENSHQTNPLPSPRPLSTTDVPLGQPSKWGDDFLRFQKKPTTINIAEKPRSLEAKPPRSSETEPPRSIGTSSGSLEQIEILRAISPVETIFHPQPQRGSTLTSISYAELSKPSSASPSVPEPSTSAPPSPSPPLPSSPLQPITPNPQPSDTAVVPQIQFVATPPLPDVTSEQVKEFYTKVEAFKLAIFSPLNGFLVALTQAHNNAFGSQNFRIFDFLCMHALLFRGEGDKTEILLWTHRQGPPLWAPPQRNWSAAEDLPCKTQDTIKVGLLKDLDTVCGLQEHQLAEGIPSRSDQAIETPGSDGKTSYGWSIGQIWEIKVEIQEPFLFNRAHEVLNVEWFSREQVEETNMHPMWKQQILKVFQLRKEHEKNLEHVRDAFLRN